MVGNLCHIQPLIENILGARLLLSAHCSRKWRIHLPTPATKVLIIALITLRDILLVPWYTSDDDAKINEIEQIR